VKSKGIPQLLCSSFKGMAFAFILTVLRDPQMETTQNHMYSNIFMIPAGLRDSF
jgi:hypothetical protein